MHDEPLEAGLHLTVGAVMTPFPVVVDRDTPLDEVAELLAQNDITGAPVVDGDGFLVGVISQTDLVRAAAADGPDGTRWAGSTAGAVMSMACTLFGMTPEEALAGMTCHAARALGLEREIGTLERGKRADFVVWDAGDPAELATQIGMIRPRAACFEGLYR